ncbi:hypothetical protein PTSG_00798 [Salpingoeca rosetta]|uniref:DWNN domain-containing protein n=1 Tax=Salpingoeca rosetta (strain ATCC 50818 / BSB-021) TaxID=946362 RepID=F2TXI3_SALR5|nr:uncharacterized protein PTSG_00798 [Salpingoeca rosetta]EGD76092.1 hypothetical protein PTSG_00798 [Salpingoeca rosetta]|eukprot:XP_004998267.1 hypothetical protein PTSG_00798 [Salpingoeca rosetta]
MASVIHYKFKNELQSSTVTFDGARMLYETLKRDVFLRHYGRSTDTDIDLIDEHSGQVYGPGDHIYKNAHIVISAKPLKPGQAPVFEDPS